MQYVLQFISVLYRLIFGEIDITKRTRMLSYSVLYQKPFYYQKVKMAIATTKTQPKTSITKQLGTELG